MKERENAKMNYPPVAGEVRVSVCVGLLKNATKPSQLLGNGR